MLVFLRQKRMDTLLKRQPAHSRLRRRSIMSSKIEKHLSIIITASSPQLSSPAANSALTIAPLHLIIALLGLNQWLIQATPSTTALGASSPQLPLKSGP